DPVDRVPPPFAPRACPTRAPLARKLREPTLGLRRHGAERVVDQVRRRLEDRKAVAVVGQLHGGESTGARRRFPSNATPTCARTRAARRWAPGRRDDGKSLAS